MRIVVTGALGHIGSKFIRDIPHYFPGAEIVMIDNLLVQRYCSLFDLPSTAKFSFTEADILKIDLESVFKGADVILHLAAITNAAASFDHPELVESVNYDATVLVGKACAKVNVPLIFLSTTSVYGTQAEVVDENCTPDELKPQSPYADSKLRGEQYLSQLGQSEGLRYIVCRFGTIFGTSIGMRFHTAVNKFCWQAVMGQSITVWKTAYDQKRPYLDLNDGVDAICWIMKNRCYDNEIYNVLSANLTVRNIVETIQRFVANVKVEFVDTRIMNQLSYEVSIEKFTKRGFVPKGDFTKGIRETIQLLKGSQSAHHSL